jgi:transcriptional regulator with XRE-family HTH domain
VTSAKNWPEIAALLRPLAKKERGSQKRAALRTGVKEYEISRFLSGEATPDPVVGAQLVHLFGLDFSELSGMGPAGTAQVVSARSGDGTPRELHGVGAPLVAIDVAAGEGALTEVDDDRLYFFGESFMRKHGWTDRAKDRFCCVKLGSAAMAESMEPTIRHGSLLLVDRRPGWDRLRTRPREIYLVRMPGEKEAVKRCTLEGEQIIIESDNPAPKYHPRAFSVTGESWRDFVRGRVLWWSMEA